MKYVRTPGFLADLRRLPDEHRKMFAAAVHELLRPALDAGAHTGAAPWPRALRIHRIGKDYSMTWSFAGPDGRALFRLAEVAGDPVVIRLRVADCFPSSELVSASAVTVRRASDNDTDSADSAERIDDPDGLLVREA